ncbi:MAG: right-handed parallel beta-helix repeat-containing protein [Phycisphaerae bacterium]|nr:right-handed parallel beta-helix repeat-containing protein [Phycisphaerae bacterium]MDW8262203.1 right-handed parallel beta-helix repeat-containing protein [Phycisphaerales bacterium]
MIARIEPLEDRKLLAVTMTADGWTKITPSSTSRMIYVSSSTGNDANPGTQDRPIKTLARAQRLVRDLHPDWVLLKRGDTWYESFPDWVVSGKSAQEPTVITSYGSGPRPKILTGTSGGITLAHKYSNPLHHVAVIGLHFHAHTYNGSNGTVKTAGIRIMRKGSNILLEDNFIQGFKDNIVIDPTAPVTDVRIRRNVIVDAFNARAVGNGHAQGIYGGPNARGTLIEENILDHNGWKVGVPNAGQTMFNHSIYFNTGSSGLVVRGNIITRSSLRGVLARGGAVVENNLFARNPVAVQVGNGSSVVQNNVILEGNDLGTTQELGKGVEAFSMSRLLVRNNVVAHDISRGRHNNIAVNIQNGVGGGEIRGNTVYNWEHGFKNAAHFTVADNRVTLSSQVASSRTNYADPNRLLGKYHASLGRTGTIESFLAMARLQSRDSWDPRYTAKSAGNYVRAGFNLATSAARPSAPAAAAQSPIKASAESIWSRERIDPATTPVV